MVRQGLLQIRLAAVVVMLGAIAAHGQIISQSHKLIPSDGAGGDSFGNDIATDGTLVIVGSSSDDDLGPQSGAAYIFSATTGAELMKLLPSDGAAADRFGASVAISGSYAVVGAPFDDDQGSASGTVYIFDTSTGQELRKLIPTDGEPGIEFGNAVAIDGDILAIGAYRDNDNGAQSGSAYLFRISTGQQLRKLLPTDGSAIDSFGFTIAIEGNTVLVGAPADSDNGFEAGSAYLFDASTGQQLSKLVPVGIQAEEYFGYSVDIEGNTLSLGAYGDDDIAVDAGAAYLFDLESRQEVFKLTNGDALANDWGGFTTSLSGNLAVVGAYRSDINGLNSGAVYLYSTETGEQLATLLPDDGTASDSFGISLSFAGNVVAVGAFGDNPNGAFSGSAYVFQIDPGDCPADTNGDGMVSPADFTAWIAAFNTQSPQCDQNGDGQCSPADFTAWIANFNAGC